MQEDEDLLIGLDIGTTNAKAGLFATDGTLLHGTVDSYSMHLQGDHAESDPESWWNAACTCLREMATAAAGRRIAGISVGGQGPTLVALDERFRPVRPAVLWLDSRARIESSQLSAAVGRPVSTSWYVPKAMWLRRFEPAAFQAIKWLAQPMDYIAYRLCGNLVAAVASLKIVPWQEDEISESGLNPSLFPPFAVMGSSIGSLTERALLETNLRRGTRVFAGAPDFVEAILATSSQEAGIVCDKAGSSEGLELCSAVPLKTGFYTALHPISDGMHHIGASISTTGLTIEWLCSLTGRTAQQLAKMAEDVPLGSSGLRFYPHLAAERSFLFGSRPEGLISGLRLHHGAPELARCMMEGCSNAVALVITEYRSAGAEISEIRVTGGQSRSMLWNQMKSDMTGLDVVVPAVPDGEMLGAAMIAAAGSGVAEGLQQASRMMAVQAGRIHPIKENSEAYRAVFQARSSN